MTTFKKIFSNRFFQVIRLIEFISLILFSLMACTKEKDKFLPTVAIVSITDITSSSAKIKTKVTDEGGGTVTGTGACWGTAINPNLSNNVSNVGAGIGEFTSIPTNLNSNTTYYVRAFATNEVGTSYSSNKSFTTLN
ncbi:hypothetical protein [Flavobacterium luteum]|uniref:Fibronectin type-III domain-containing protein n=1 Tax=Flavobacterium luteum TaxID=2026654 RepID=A0A7J5AJD1_9FLAO|nr:hypothetical protein [Flavobacterium luteum]KAB1157717.1 hypothetical protein F6464_01130 [Flavobacterium luteum]